MARRRDLLEGDAEAQKGDTDTQPRLGRELDACEAFALVLGQEVEGHPDQQGRQHHGRAIMLRDELGRQCDDDSHQDAGKHDLCFPEGREAKGLCHQISSSLLSSVSPNRLRVAGRVPS